MSLTAALASGLAGAALALGGVVGWRRLGLPAPAAAAPPGDPAPGLAEAVFEQASQPLLVVIGNRVARANAAARAALGAHVVGQDPRVGLRHPEAIRLLDAEADGSASAPGLLGGRTLWQLTRHTLNPGCWLLELTDRTAEADVSRAHTDFVANASHELRTPLAAIIGYAETLTDAGAELDPATAQRFTGIIGREAQRMLTLVDDLMTLSHVEAEKHERPSEPLDLGQLAARVVAEVSSLRGKERVVLEAPAAGLVVAGDAGQLEQALRNLIDNALKYGAPDQPVAVSAQRAGERVVLAVRDHGPGIAPDHLPHLTRRFYRTDPGRSRASGGTGLGLAIVKHIVERHGGELDIASTLGEGSTFSLALPAVAG